MNNISWNILYECGPSPETNRLESVYTYLLGLFDSLEASGINCMAAAINVSKEVSKLTAKSQTTGKLGFLSPPSIWEM